MFIPSWHRAPRAPRASAARERRVEAKRERGAARDSKMILLSLPSLELCLRRLQTATTATTLSTSRIRRRRRDVFDSANLQPGARQRAKRALPARTRRLRLITPGRAHLNVQRRDTELFASRGDVLRREHRRIRRGFIAISLHLHPAGASAQGFLARQIRHVLRRRTRASVSLSQSSFGASHGARENENECHRARRRRPSSPRRARVVIAIVRATIALGLSSRHRHRHRHRASLARVASHRSFEHAPRKYR